jgi:hypothetical protein
MTYYVHIQNKKIIGKGQCKQLTEGVLNIEVEEEIYNKIEKYVYIDGEIVLNPAYEAEQAAKEAERIAHLYLTGADVERGIYQAKGMDFDDILEFVKAMQPEGLDIKALKIELKANNFYRGNPYVDAIGSLLGFTKEQLDLFFEYNDYTYLLPVEEPTDEENPIVEDVTGGEDVNNSESEVNNAT